jgi:Zonular occludens toxin (Zot)
VVDAATGNRIALRRNASSGTPIESADQAAMSQFMVERVHYAVFGHVPNSGLLASIVNRHNGPAASAGEPDTGGYGEARHVVIFGQNGSGKTVLLTMHIAVRLGAHPQMGLLMPDTSGDLADPGRHSRGDFRWNYQEVLETVDVQIERISIDDVKLTSAATLVKKLAPLLRQQLSMGADYPTRLAERVTGELFQKGIVDIDELTVDAVLASAEKQVLLLYAGDKTGKEKAQRITEIRETPHMRLGFEMEFARVRDLFDGRFPVRDLVRDVLEHERKIVIEMSGMLGSEQKFVMAEIMTQLKGQAERIFKRSGKMANALVVLDEGQRWAPEGSDNEEGLSEIIEDGFRTTRKYGVGWIIVAQSPAGLSKKIIRECHTRWFGRNLGVGVDRSHLENSLGEDGANAYRLLAQQGGYFWVAAGLDNNISDGSGYFTLHPFGGDATQALIDANPHIFDPSSRL